MTSAGVQVDLPRFAPTRGSWPARIGGFVRQHPEVVTALLCVLVLGAGLRGPDLPAQVYRVTLFRHHGFVAFDAHWYAGHPLPGYSLLFPPLASVLGARLLGGLSCVAATAAFTRLLRGNRRTGHDIAVLWFAVVSVVDLVVGRLPFALGVAFGLGALVAVRERRAWWGLLLAVACSCASPLAGAFLLLGGAAYGSVAGVRAVLPLLGVLLGIGAAEVFGEGGWFPFPATTLLVIGLLVIGGLVVLPRSATIVRRGLVLYGVASVVLFPFHNPIGGNMVRLGATFAGPAIAYELWRAHRHRLLLLVSIPLLIWQFAPLPASVAAGPGNPSSRPSYYAGLISYLQAHGGATSRLEVPLTNGRWESAYLAAKVSLARGWERQVDLGDNDVLYQHDLNAAGYYQWLQATGVRWVALPDVPLDASEVGEQALLTGTVPSYLRPVWHDAHWRLWAVRGARPLVEGPARLVRIGVSTIDLDATGAGRAVVLVRWTRFWRVTTGQACVAPTNDGWTAVDLTGPGRVRISARVGFGSLAGAGGGGSCSKP